MSGTVTTHLVTLTNTAASFTQVPMQEDSQVVTNKGVASFTVGFPFVDSLNALASQKVLSDGDKVKMKRVDTDTVSTQVIGYESFGTWADNKFMGETVRSNAFVKIGEPSVSIWVGRIKPQPALTKVRTTNRQRAVLVDLKPKPRCFV